MTYREMERTAEVAPSRGPMVSSVVTKKMRTLNIYSRTARPCATLIASVFWAHSQILTAIKVVLSAMKISTRWMVRRADLPSIVAAFTPSDA